MFKCSNWVQNPETLRNVSSLTTAKPANESLTNLRATKFDFNRGE